ncbi:hypothetical protein Fcan01_07121 [Folsomia candida]|uniref:Uncharacterized protein n=1 Tax=Folsomia candida TaxID=158441 RepID=A0A226ENM0_FOLCA|nr:hypothetical protein Fcan01_07121 [Folsomia candida]
MSSVNKGKKRPSHTPISLFLAGIIPIESPSVDISVRIPWFVHPQIQFTALEISPNSNISNPGHDALEASGGLLQSNLSSNIAAAGGVVLLGNKSSSNYYNIEKESDRTGNRGMRSDKEKERLALLKKIQLSDQHNCFSKILCGLSVDSSQNSKDIDSHFVRSYIELMRSANPNDDSSEETRTSLSNSNHNDAISEFLMRSGLLVKPKKRQSHSASSSEEEGSSNEPLKTPKKNESLKSLLTKRRLSTSRNDDDDLTDKDEKNPFRLLPVLHLAGDGADLRDSVENNDNRPSSVTSKIGSLVSAWVPWVSLSFGRDSSFESDPFFKGNASKLTKKNEERWQKDLDKLAMLMRAETRKTRNKNKSKSKRQRQRQEQGRNFVGIPDMDDEIKVYSTAVDIGKKLKSTKQCDYLYNGCGVKYADIIQIISTIRKDLKQSDETVESLSKEILEYSKRKKVTKHQPTSRPKRPTQVQNQKQMQKPMTQISHTLPNGEKEDGIEIESPHGDSFVSDEESENISVDISQQKPTIPEEEFDENDPAISASYELAAEKLQGDRPDHRKPTPLHIFNKLSLRKKSTTVRPTKITSTPKYAVSAKKRRPTATTDAVSTKRPRPTTTKLPIRSPPTWPTSKKPSAVNTKRPTKRPSKAASRRPSGQQTLKKSSSFPTTTMKPKPSKPTRKTQSNVDDDTEDTKPAMITKTYSKITFVKGSAGEGFNKNKKSHRRNTTTTTQRPVLNYDDDDIDFPSSPQSGKITIEIDKSSTQEEVDSESEPKEAVINGLSTTTKRPKLTTTTTSTPPPLAMFTNSYMDDVIAEMSKTVRPKIKKTTTTPTLPPKRRRKPIIYNSHNHQHNSNGHFLSPPKNNPSTPENSYYVSSVESGSGEAHVFGMPQLGEGGSQWTPYEQEKEKAQPDLDDPATKQDQQPNTDDVEIEPPKKRIVYKNPKRPYLILMKPGDDPKKKRPTPTSTPEQDNNPNSDISEALPLVIEPGSSDYSHWTPEY